MTEKYSRTEKACYKCGHITYMGDPDECQKCGHETYIRVPSEKMTRKLHFKRHWNNFSYWMGGVWDNITEFFSGVFYYKPRTFYRKRRDKFRDYMMGKNIYPKWELTVLTHIRKRIYMTRENFFLYEKVKFFKSYYKLFHKPEEPEEEEKVTL